MAPFTFRRIHRAFIIDGARGANSPLAKRLLSVIFACYFSIALLVTCFQTVLEYRNERVKMHEEIDAAVQLVLPVLLKTLWDYDEGGTSATLKGLARNRALVGLRLEGDIRVSLGSTPPAAGATNAALADEALPAWLYEQRFPITNPLPDGASRNIATLRVYSSSTTVLQRSMGVLAGIMASALVKTLALWLVLYYALRTLVARPLVRLADGLNKLRDDQAGDQPGRTGPDMRPRNELAFALHSFGSMRRALRRSRHALLGYQQELERKVRDRTRELHHQAMHDELTGLLNRRAFEGEMTQLLGSRPEPDVPCVLCLLDLDHFKLVNDSFGHAAGDKVLRQVAEILRRNTRATDIVARMGGDEFALILTDCSIHGAQAKMQVLGSEIQALRMEKDGKRVVVGLSAGLVSLSLNAGSEPNTAMAHADAACYAAKQSGRHQAKVFTDSKAATRRRNDVNWVSVINRALDEDQMLLYAQPILATGDRAVRCIEVLVRMMLDGKVVGPDSFLPAAERHGLMPRIDAWVVSRTLAVLQANPGMLARLECVHINLAAASVCEPGFYRHVVRELRRRRVPPSKVFFEITESAAIMRLDVAVRIMKGLKARGVRFALDDFGNGMSSYTYLQALPVDRVKIDGSFVRRMTSDAVSAAIVASINDIAHLAGMSTVAEFVEDEVTFRKLAEIGVDYQQGHHLGVPVPIARLADEEVSERAAESIP